MKKLMFVIIVAILLPLSVLRAQSMSFGPMLGVGLGGLKGEEIKIKTGISPELGLIVKYNITKESTIRTFITLEYNNYIFEGGKQFEDISGLPTTTLVDAEDYHVRCVSFTHHVDYTYVIIEDHLDVSGGAFYNMKFTGEYDEYNQPRVFYNVNNSTLSYASSEDVTQLYTSDQIHESLKGAFKAGLYLAATAGTEKFKIMFRYDMFLGNYYSKFSKTNKLKENYLRIGLIYFYTP